jgi:hypothetical protein
VNCGLIARDVALGVGLIVIVLIVGRLVVEMILFFNSIRYR